ncbi:MAG: aminoacyl-tRNA hydrolase [Dehalococcoidia bacterium]
MSAGLWERLRALVSRPSEVGGEAAGEPPRVRLIVGLGNPGADYAQNRHNVGFWTVNRLARRHDIEFTERGRLAFSGAGRIGPHEVTLAKPRTFVNRSGGAVVHLVRRFKLDSSQELLVVCDDLDLPLGKLRVRARGGYGGQKGLQSVIEATRTEDFPRVRIGIGRPVVDGEPSYDPEAVASYVLSDPPPEERRLLDEAVERAQEAIECILEEGVEVAMARYN